MTDDRVQVPTESQENKPNPDCEKCGGTGIVYWAPAHSASCPECFPWEAKWTP